MLRACGVLQLRARPKTVCVEPGSNRLPEALVVEKARDIFGRPEFPGKRVLHNWRFFIKAGKAATGPPVGQEFSKLGLKAMDFAKVFNDRTKPHFKEDVELIVRIQVYFDKSYLFTIEPPPTAWFILRALRKKRRETGPVPLRGHYCALMTLEMAYEIAKMKPLCWGRPEYPLLETRVRRVVGQARRMGVCFIGVDTPYSSPVKDMTEQQYTEECERYRRIHMEQYTTLRQRELEEAPLIERLHRPNMSPLTDEQIEEGLRDPCLLDTLWRASHPLSPYHRDLRERELARRYLNARGWVKDMTPEEMRIVFMNYRLPEGEKRKQMDEPAMSGEVYWTRDGAQL
ncbi:ribosomal protein L11, putative [Trypanosoma brucei gambiense DAL972]|uniref:Ribosomal protein L11, putative n=1 Tax=Trypanosoma brucei gambiense (strain MHOM/CI/86/DAL972) TaxID=679716 RepID=C9ZJI7_TRYB9|nr:ribosomal protein L11, putative [Trypanosoma brucei gambiense DAL972]CBH09546.1 ribosomal protein L11, putative [Trypanosoma brucei gambiense DAL972]|eukprot:XP_011771851.1 ribosomal protein L11, putative [Trypanosoma brucei gambiense DAL972]